MMKTVGAWIVMAGMAAGALGCDAGGLDSQCGEGFPTEVDGRTLCVYEAPIIETGFDCPADLPARMDFAMATVCAPAGELPPGRVDQLVEQFGQQGDPALPGAAGAQDPATAGNGGADAASADPGADPGAASADPGADPGAASADPGAGAVDDEGEPETDDDDDDDDDDELDLD